MDPTERMRHLNELLPLFGQAATANSLQESGIQLADQFLQVEGWELDKNLFKCDIGKRDTIDPSMLDQLQKQSVAKPPPLVVDQNSIMAVCVIHEQGERQLGPFLGALRTQLDTYASLSLSLSFSHTEGWTDALSWVCGCVQIPRACGL